MTDYSNLNHILKNMENAAEQGLKEKLAILNVQFCAEYNRLVPYKDMNDISTESKPYLYDMARNKLMNVIDDFIAPTAEKKMAQLAQAREIIAKIK